MKNEIYMDSDCNYIVFVLVKREVIQMQILIDIPEEVLKTRYYTDYFGCGSHKLTETLDNATPYSRKGHWIVGSDTDIKGETVYWFTCSECKSDRGQHTNYCPDCGAKMDNTCEVTNDSTDIDKQ